MPDEQNSPTINPSPTSDSSSFSPTFAVLNLEDDVDFNLDTDCSPSTRISTLHIANLHPFITRSAVSEIFGNFSVASLDVTRPPYKDSLHLVAFASITFSSPLDAKNAFLQLHMIKHPRNSGRALRILQLDMPFPAQIDPKAHVFIRGLHEDICEVELWDTFSQFGTMVWCDISTDRDGRSLGHGSLIFEDAETASHVIEIVNGKMILGRIVAVDRFRGQEERAVEKSEKEKEEIGLFKVVVKNIKYEVKEKQLRELLQGYGGLVKFRLCLDSWGRSKGLAVLWFHTKADARGFRREKNGMIWFGRKLAVKVLPLGQKRDKPVGCDGRADGRNENGNSLRSSMKHKLEERLR